MRKLRKGDILKISIVGCFGLSLALALLLNTWTFQAWVPSLACNLVTTGIAIWVINVVVADVENREQSRIETFRQHRKELHEMKRKAHRRELMKPQAGLPVATTLQIGMELITIAKTGDLNTVLGHIRNRQAVYREHSEALGHMTLLYNRFLTFKELNALEGLRRLVKWLALEVDQPGTDDERKVQIMDVLEVMNVCAIAISMAFVDQELTRLQGEFNGQMGDLRRRWDVPGIRRRLREQQHTPAPGAALPKPASE